MTTTDTRAALDAVLAAIDNDTHEGRAVSLSDHAELKSAITAHVAAEVARALACAPDVDAALDDLSMEFCISSYALDPLLAAIAADKARAVEAATAGAIPKLSRDDAEALVDEFARRFAARSRSSNRTTLVWDREAAARAALLRALGVEA